MFLWFFFAFGSAIAQSVLNALSNEAVKVARFSKIGISLVVTTTASLILIAASFLFLGLPDLKPGFWPAVLISGTLNIVMLPLGLRAYELGEFSSVYSMSLAAPVFLLFTGWIFLGELPPVYGMAGVVLSVLGLWTIGQVVPARNDVPDFRKGNLLGLLVALLASVSVNFDKLAVLYSNRIFAYGAGAGIMALGYGVYLLISRQPILVKNYTAEDTFSFRGIFILLLAGIIQAANGVLYNSALAIGFTSYTIAIKRLGVLFGVFWGWLFFREKNISRKLLGAGLALAGVLLILFS